jgi:hypothetical protein
MTGDWLGQISAIETGYNNNRLNGQTLRNQNAKGKLYVLVNLLNTFDYKETYAHLASMTRKMNYEGTLSNYSLADRYVLTYHELYGVNVSSYFEAWGEPISQSVKDIVKNDESLLVLNDAVNDSDLTNTIQSDLGLEGKYSLVKQSVLEKYELKSTVKIHINIDNIDNIKGKYIYLNGGSDSYKVEITGTDLSLEVNAGAYQVTTPIPNENYYTYNSYYTVNAVSNKENELTIDYITNNDAVLGIDTEIYLNGQGSFVNIKFDSKNINITATGDVTHWYWGADTDYAYVKVYDENGTLVYEKHYVGSTWTTKGTDSIPYKKGYKIEIYHAEGKESNRIKIINKYTGDIITSLTHITGVNTYYINEYGLYQVNEDGTSEEDANYGVYVDLVDSYATKLINELTEEEMANKNLKRDEKAVLFRSINKLKESDKKAYLKKYNYIFNGSSPVLNTNEITLTQGDVFSFTDLFKATDVEDGEIILNKDNSSYKTNLPLKNGSIISKAGNYTLDYEIIDGDSNTTKGTVNITVLEKENESTNVDASTNNSDNKVDKKPTSNDKTTVSNDKNTTDKTTTNSTSKNENTTTNKNNTTSNNTVSTNNTTSTSTTTVNKNDTTTATTTVTTSKNSNKNNTTTKTASTTTNKTNNTTTSSSNGNNTTTNSESTSNVSTEVNSSSNETTITTNSNEESKVSSSSEATVITDSNKEEVVEATDNSANKFETEISTWLRKIPFFDKWLDNEHTTGEFIIFIICMGIIATMLAYIDNCNNVSVYRKRY